MTERCVFELMRGGLKLTEVAPGVDIEKDILALMGARPLIEEVRPMDARIFRQRETDLRIDFLRLDLPDRIAVDPATRQLFLNCA